MTVADHERPALVFCAYSHRDAGLCQELKTAFAGLMQQSLIRFWFDRLIRPGDNWENEIAKELEDADIILLLISNFFVESNYCFRREMARALARHDEGTARVIPIHLRWGDYEGLPFMRLQGLPPGLTPIDSKRNHHKAWMTVSQAIRREREQLFAQRLAPEVQRHVAQEPELYTFELETYLRHVVFTAERQLQPVHRLSLSVEHLATKRQFTNAVEALCEWASGTTTEHVLLLTGEFGSGKSTTLREFAGRLAGERMRSGKGVVPLFLTAQLLAHSMTELQRSYGEGRAVIEEVMQGAPAVIIVDTIDESSADQPAAATLADLIASAPRSARFVVACRATARMEIARILSRSGAGIDVYELLPLSRADVLLYLTASQKGEELTPAASDLVRQPEVLQLLEIAGKKVPLGRVPSLYGLCRAAVVALFRGLIEREASLIVTEAQLFAVCADIAGQMFPSGAVRMERVAVDISGGTREQIVSALVAVRVLTIDARENLSFAHATFFEYFYAAYVGRTLSLWQSDVLAGINLIYAHTINRFLVPMVLERVHVPVPRADPLITTALTAGAVRIPGGILTRAIRRSEVARFVRDTGWRENTGFGAWRTFEAPDGTTGSSDGSFPEWGAPTIEAWMCDEEAAATSLSWYDAMQFALWAGGSLPNIDEVRAVKADDDIEAEWTASWLNEEQSLISVWKSTLNETAGYNPDFRSRGIGFRVVLPFVDP